MSATEEKHLSPQGAPYDDLSHFVNIDGQHIFTRSWQPPEGVDTRALALVLHGLSEHSGRYSPVAEVLVAKGISTYAHDHVGHGQSEGTRIDVSDFDIFVRDVLQHSDLIRQKHPDIPIFLIGHSMGGTIAILTMIERPTFFAGCVLIGAAIQANPAEATPFKMFMAKFSARYFPQLGIAGVNPKWLSHSAEEVEDYATDELVYHGKIKARIGVQLLKGMEKIEAHLETIDWPVLILHGDEDRLTLVDGARLMNEKIASKDKTLKIYPGHYHVLHRETPSDATVVKQDIINWIDERIERRLEHSESKQDAEQNEETKEKSEGGIIDQNVVQEIIVEKDNGSELKINENNVDGTVEIQE